MTVLVTGGAGAIGGNVARMLLEKGQRVVVYDRIPVTPQNKVLAGFDEPQLVSEVGAISDTSAVFDVVSRHKVDGIVHLAGMLPPHQCDLRPVEAINTNIVGTANVLEAARILGISPVVCASAAGVMGRPKDVHTPRKEEDVILPLAGIYQMTKLAIEQLVYSYRQLHKMTGVTAIRPRNVYGPGCAPRIQPLFELFFAALDGQDFVRPDGGDSTFDYTYVKDMAKGVVQLFETKAPPSYVYNLSRGRATKMSECAEVMQRLFPAQRISIGPGAWEGVIEGGKEFELTVHPAVMPPQDVSRAAQDFGYAPEWDIERGLTDWVRWSRTGAYR
ncbi:MAG: NAD(P)-dependent oxidoreductase [Chloroflexota bacterium]|nr:NAD(P)-dependent oxidoreductase [Chloroflexota bacterium]